MAFRKLYIAVDCNSLQEEQEVQKILDELSNILRLKGSELITNAPMIRKNQNLIREMFQTIQRNGMKGIISLVPLAMKFKR
jgi:hypothetical protein